MCSRTERGQASVEAAFLIPVILVLLLMLLQPGILLYDRVVMMSAAAEGCRLAATSGSGTGVDQEMCKQVVKRHLGAIPPHPLFHLHEGECSYVVEATGDQSSGQVTVSIVNKVKPVPLIDMGAVLLGLTDGSGCLSVDVEVSMPTQPTWVGSEPSGMDPHAWVHERD